ncbi:MAG TPA: hypothetical protein VGL72_24740 [Bryobacteraceae bacterium]
MDRQRWEDLVGSKICGGYAIRDLIGSTERSAVYSTFQGEERVALKLLRADEAAPPASHEIPRIDHPAIIRLLTSSDCEVDGVKYRSFVMEAAEENLGTVIASRALSPDEAREMLGPVLDAVGYLHERGLAHGSVKPSNILARGDSVKLSVDSIRPSGAVASAEQDLRDLGLTVVEVLTQHRQASAIADLPQPFRDIVEHALAVEPTSRWSARQAALRLSGKVPAPPPAAAPSPAAPKPAIPAEKKPVKPIERPLLAEPASPPEHSRKVSPVLLLGALAAAMLLVIVFVMARGSSSSSADSTPAPTPTPKTQQQVSPIPQPTVKTPAPPPTRQSPFQSKSAPAPAPVTPAPAASIPLAQGHGWYVVVASYSREPDAQTEARTLSRRFSQFHFSVFPPSLIDTHYLVIIGSGLGQDGADSLRERAVSAGLPQDTYIKKYPESKH